MGVVNYTIPEPTMDWPTVGETFIKEYRNVVSEEICREAYALFMDSPNKFEGMTGTNYATGSVNKGSKSSLDLDVCSEVAKDPRWIKIATAFKEAIGKTGPLYVQHVVPLYYVCADSGLENTGFQIQYYLNNGQDGFKPHVDRNSIGSSNRELAVIIYLNDVEEGGETCFPIQNAKVKPEMGKVVWFPAGFTHPHEGKTPISNPKLIVTTFMVYSEDVSGPNEANNG